VAESVQATTAAGEAVQFSFAGKISRAGDSGDVVYQLRVDKVRAE
jgi:hypothetical protein